MRKIAKTADVGPGTVIGSGSYAVGNVDGEYFAVSRRCRHLRADLAGGTIDEDGCLVCPWHHAAYDVHTGEMVRGPQGVFGLVPGLGTAFELLTRVVPLRRADVEVRGKSLYLDD